MIPGTRGKPLRMIFAAVVLCSIGFMWFGKQNLGKLLAQVTLLDRDSLPGHDAKAVSHVNSVLQNADKIIDKHQEVKIIAGNVGFEQRHESSSEQTSDSAAADRRHLPKLSLEYHGYQVAVWSSLTKTPPESDSVTWTTQMTSDRTNVFEKLLERWTGPCSIAVYTKDLVSDIAIFRKFFSRCDFHFVPAAQGPYPVNTLRNVAINHVRTKWMLLADVDFIPNVGAHELITKRFNEMDKYDGKAVFVLPAFQLKEGLEIPKDKAQMLDFMKDRRAHQVHDDPGRKIAHDKTDYDTWKTAEFIYAASYQFPYEPYYVAPTTIPRYDVRFAGYGNDKATQCYEVDKAGYRFTVLPDSFVVHVDHPPGQWLFDLRITQEERMKTMMSSFFSDMARRYGEPEGKLPAIPPSLGFKSVMGGKGESCDSVCSREGLKCNSEHSQRVNRCSALEEAATCLYGCNDMYYGNDLPVLDESKEMCLMNSKPSEFPFLCDAQHPSTRRLCPCTREL